MILAAELESIFNFNHDQVRERELEVLFVRGFGKGGCNFRNWMGNFHGYGGQFLDVKD